MESWRPRSGHRCSRSGLAERDLDVALTQFDASEDDNVSYRAELTSPPSRSFAWFDL